MDQNIITKEVPKNTEVEEALLGSILINYIVINDVVDIVAEDDFYDIKNKTIFGAMKEMSEQGKVIDIVTLSDNLSARSKLDMIGGVVYLQMLTDKVIVSTSASAVEYANIILQKSVLRKLINASGEIISECYKGNDSRGVIEFAERKIFDISQNKQSTGFSRFQDVISSTFTRIRELAKIKGDITGIDTGLIDLNKKTSGFQNSDFVLLAARPSMGKTALALNLCVNAAKDDNVVAIFSLEMSKEQLVQRILSAESLVPLNNIKSGQLESDHWQNIMVAISKLNKLNIYIDDTPAINVSEVRAKLRRLKMEKGLGFVMIDYLQLMSGSGSENRQQEISNISRSLKSIAREMECPLLSLSQLSRGPESREDKRPMLSDLRDSGAIEQDADLVMFLYREHYYKREKRELENVAELIIAKHRNGETGKIDLFWQGEYQLFNNLAANDVPKYNE